MTYLPAHLLPDPGPHRHSIHDLLAFSWKELFQHSRIADVVAEEGMKNSSDAYGVLLALGQWMKTHAGITVFLETHLGVHGLEGQLTWEREQTVPFDMSIQGVSREVQTPGFDPSRVKDVEMIWSECWKSLEGAHCHAATQVSQGGQAAIHEAVWKWFLRPQSPVIVGFTDTHEKAQSPVQVFDVHKVFMQLPNERKKAWLDATDEERMQLEEVKTLRESGVLPSKAGSLRLKIANPSQARFEQLTALLQSWQLNCQTPASLPRRNISRL